ncbi:exonuclease SbcC, partial [Enterococcus mundtii]|nr:exonuclease SbcC [Enterococcus mundtii]
TKKSQWASLQIQRLSLLLEEGEPCLVCGSLEHPKQQTHQEVSLEEIDQADRQLTEVEKTVQRFTETLSALGAEKQQKESQLQEQEAAYTEEQEQLAAQFADLQLPLTGLTFSQVTPAEIAEVESQLAKEKQQIAQKLTEISVEKDRLAELEEQVAENSQRFEVLRQQVETMQQSLERITIQQQMIASQLLDATVTYEEMTKQQALLQEELSAFERQKEN